MSDRPADIEFATPDEIAEAARIISGAGLVEAFGHVSSRSADGFLITATRPLGAAGAGEVYSVDPEGNPLADAPDLPLETPMHAAVYAARPDVGAICRTHSPAAVRAGARGEVPPLVHGLGGLAGSVNFCSRTDLVTDLEAGNELAAALDDGDCVLVRGNGSLATGPSLAHAVVRARYLEERCLIGEESDSADGWRAVELDPR
ncbi:MAG: class II aldolase/adducin family protein, partial [Solirubrobacterales bacterium]